jgi:hypothetical protein
MQTPTQPPTPALAPAAPAPNATSVTITGSDGKPQTIQIPKTQAQVDLLVSRRSQISDQMSSLNDRRSELVDNIRTAPDGIARTGVEERVRLLDQRLLQLESDLASTNSQLAITEPDLISIAEARNSPHVPDDEFTPGLAVDAPNRSHNSHVNRTRDSKDSSTESKQSLSKSSEFPKDSGL